MCRSIFLEVWVNSYLIILIYFFLVVFSKATWSKDELTKTDVDFINYEAKIKPDFRNKSIDGNVVITFIPLVHDLNLLNFSAKFKQIKSVFLGETELDFSISNGLLTLKFPIRLENNTPYSIHITYIATPPRGIKFYDDHLFTVYHTKNWLVSHSDLSDKATFDLSITHDSAFTAVGNGTFISHSKIGRGQVVSRWKQPIPVPLYTFGFALGHFKKLSLESENIDISVLYRQQQKSGLSEVSIREAFRDVADMLSFFEDKAGFPLKQSYSYVVVDGYMAQEASGFSLVGEKFVHTLLANKNENWFIAHELAHEWWGNSITSANFSHFWLNEGLVVFLVAAYKQHLFGEKAYKDEINVALKRVQRAVKENRAAPVAFSKIIKEQEINRTMAYSKGALVFYMLREKLGNKIFWQCLKQYSLTFKDKTVTTQNLKSVCEQTSGIDLSTFFDRWVYGQEIPVINL